MTKSLLFTETAPDYPGVITQGADLRLIVSPRGASYALQERVGSAWQYVGTFVTGAQLKAWCAVVAINLPRTVVSAASVLPDDPQDCLHVPVPSKRRRSNSERDR